MTATKATNEAEILERLHEWAKAVHAKDVDQVMSNYGPDILLFDLALRCSIAA
jgi:ketosteroid isomerase-like protein